jgi:hypothetical protein
VETEEALIMSDRRVLLLFSWWIWIGVYFVELSVPLKVAGCTAHAK